MEDRKKLSAIIAAVNAYLDEEASAVVTTPQRPMAGINVWQLYGRQEIMQMRSLWQRRIIPK